MPASNRNRFSANHLVIGILRQMRSVIVKVGGSLLTLSDLPDRLRKLINSIAADRVMLLAGGGPATDLVRDWDGIHELGAEVSHWLAIDSMSLTARLLSKLLPDAELVTDRTSANDLSLSSQTVILDPLPIIEEASKDAGPALPLGWDCTSDSVAAWIAGRWNAHSLVLAKSVDMPEGDVAFGQRQTPAIDRCFRSVHVSELPVYWCNIRSRPELVELWKSGHT